MQRPRRKRFANSRPPSPIKPRPVPRRRPSSKRPLRTAVSTGRVFFRPRAGTKPGPCPARSRGPSPGRR
ncbi:MAG: hypothetical protein FJY80_14055 [Candidatus Aminicenantes bacterium]|nr:hypothetical protein [Candidatus Aminicenantes bacterium]